MNFVHELNIWIRSNGGGTEVKRQGYKVTGLFIRNSLLMFVCFP